MPIAAENAVPMFAAMILVLQYKWDAKAWLWRIEDSGSKVVVDDIMLHVLLVTILLQYFWCVLEVLHHN